MQNLNTRTNTYSATYRNNHKRYQATMKNSLYPYSIKKRKHRIFVSLLFVMTLFLHVSCEKVLEFEGKNIEPMLVVNCILNTDSVVVEVTKSLSALDNSGQFEIIKDASITMGDETNEYKIFKYISKIDSIYEYDKYGDRVIKKIEYGYYFCNDFVPQQGKTYTLEVNANGYKTVTAATTLPNLVNILSIDTSTVEEAISNYTMRSKLFKINFQDPINNKNYYLLEIKKASVTAQYDSISEQYSFTPTVSNAYYANNDPAMGSNTTGYANSGISFGSAFSDELINGKEYGLRINIEPYYYTPNSYFYSGYHLVTPDSLTCLMFKVKLYSINESLFQYIRTTGTQRSKKDDPFAEPVLAYNNIKNGAGIFSGQLSDEKIIIYSRVPDILKTVLPVNATNSELWNIIEKMATEYSKETEYNYW